MAKIAVITGAGSGIGRASALALLVPALGGLQPGQKLPLLQLTLPALRQLTSQELDAFFTTLDELVHADGRVTEFVEKPGADALIPGEPYRINAGTYVLSAAARAAIPHGEQVSIERDTFPLLAERGGWAAHRRRLADDDGVVGDAGFCLCRTCGCHCCDADGADDERRQPTRDAACLHGSSPEEIFI